MNTSNYKGKEIFNFIRANYPAENVTRTVIINGHNFALDDTKTVTLARMQDIHASLCKLTGVTLGYIEADLSAFEPGEYDGANPKLWEKTYKYYPKANRLLIWENGEYVYENENGVITRDKVALADTYC